MRYTLITFALTNKMETEEQIDPHLFMVASLIPYCCEKRTIRGKEKWVVRKQQKDGWGIPLFLAIEEAIEKGYEINEEWKEKVMNTTPLVSRAGAEVIRKGIWKEKFFRKDIPSPSIKKEC